MEDILIITRFLGWCTIINLSFYLFTVAALLSFKAPVKTIHSRFFGIDSNKLDEIYFHYLGNFKLIIIVFNLVPYIALKILSA